MFFLHAPLNLVRTDPPFGARANDTARSLAGQAHTFNPNDAFVERRSRSALIQASVPGSAVIARSRNTQFLLVVPRRRGLPTMVGSVPRHV